MLNPSFISFWRNRFRRSVEIRRGWSPFPNDLMLEGSRVRLRWPRLSDEEDIFAYASDTEVCEYMDWSLHTEIGETRQFMDALEKARNAGREAALGIIERDSNRLIGICSLVGKPDPRRAELGYVLRRSAWGKGYMTEAVRLICSWGFSALDLGEIYAEVHPENLASQAVLEKAGFKRQSGVVLRALRGKKQAHFRYHLHPNELGRRVASNPYL